MAGALEKRVYTFLKGLIKHEHLVFVLSTHVAADDLLNILVVIEALNLRLEIIQRAR